MSRTKEREQLFGLIFQTSLNPNSIYDSVDSEYLSNSFEEIKKHWSDIEENIKTVMSIWNYDEIGSIEKALLIVAFYEISYAKIHPKIVVNEIVELSKKYGDERSPKFLNGILAKIFEKE